MTIWRPWLGAAVCAAPLACAHAGVAGERQALDAWRPEPLPETWAAEAAAAIEAASSAEIDALEGALPRFVGYALRRSPELQAAHAQWRAAVEGVAVAGRLPEPELGYGAFVQAVETRVGPQLHRISLRQAVPWPGRLDAATDARAAAASAEGEAFRARVLALVRDVAVAYWELWQVERVHAIRLDHERVLDGLAATIRARVETGDKAIADLLQVQLRLQALRDHRSEHRSAKRRRQARLLAAVGADPGSSLRTAATEPPVELPAETMTTLRQIARRNPLVRQWSEVESSRVAEARAARASRLPNFTVGADYIVTGEARVPGVEDSGKDPVVLSLGLSLPIWLDSYASEVRSAEARATAARAARRGVWLRLAAELESTVARLRETHARIVRYEATLIPQVEALRASVSAAYEVGRAGVSEVMLALEDELDLRLELARTRAAHAAAWAELERLTGRTLETVATGEAS